MKLFLHAHATHPDAHMALALAAAQIEAQRQEPGRAGAPTLGWLYITDHYAARAEALLAEARQRWPGVAWVGAVGVGIAANGVEYFDKPALSLMLAELPREQFRVFSGARPLGDFVAHTAQVHADPATADLADLVADMSRRTTAGYLFGGLASARTGALHLADGVLRGGLSGVGFGPGVALVSRVTQGCQPVGPLRTITAAKHNLINTLDGEPALNCLLRDLQLEEFAEPREALPRLRQTLVGLSDAPSSAPSSAPNSAPSSAPRSSPSAAAAVASGFDTPARRGAFGSDTRVRHLIGLDPARRGIAIGDVVEPGMQLAFCTRNTEAARRDLVRICAEIREEVEPETLPLASALALKSADAAAFGIGGSAGMASHGIAGAVYVSCTGRGGAHFGAPSAELALVRHTLGDVPLVGFFAAGEIARHHLYGYTGVLTVFRSG
jgi:small ligand-binding sensory domain FIST